VVQFIRAYVYFHTRNADYFLQALELPVKANPNISTNAELSVYCPFTGQTDRAMDLFERARQLNPHIPSWYNLTPLFAHAFRAEHEQALAAAQQSNA
jgi:hypothetical protein